MGALAFGRLHHLNLYAFEVELEQELVDLQTAEATDRDKVLRVRRLLAEYCKYLPFLPYPRVPLSCLKLTSYFTGQVISNFEMISTTAFRPPSHSPFYPYHETLLPSLHSQAFAIRGRRLTQCRVLRRNFGSNWEWAKKRRCVGPVAWIGRLVGRQRRGVKRGGVNLECRPSTTISERSRLNQVVPGIPIHLQPKFHRDRFISKRLPSQSILVRAPCLFFSSIKRSIWLAK